MGGGAVGRGPARRLGRGRHQGRAADRRPDAQRLRLARHRRRHAEPGVRPRQPGQAQRRAGPPRARGPRSGSRSCWPPPTCSSRNLRPDALDKLDLEPEATVARHPRLVYCSVSGYGLRGRRTQPPDLRHRRLLGPLGALDADGRRRGQPAQRPRRRSATTSPGSPRWPGSSPPCSSSARPAAGRVVEVSLLRTGAYVLGWDLGLQMTLGQGGRRRAPATGTRRR